MNPEEMKQTVEELSAQVEDLTSHLEETREERSALLRERFDLKEQRRYFRAQLREAKAADNTQRQEEIHGRLDDLEQQLADKDSQLEQLESQMEDLGNQIEDLMEDLGEVAGPQETPTEEARPREEEDFLKGTMLRLNGLVQKGFKKVADTLENIDFEQVGENVQSAATKAAKTVSSVASDAAKSVETAWNEAKENRQRPGGVGDYRASGSSVLDGGCYNRISVSGTCKISSDLVCREMRSSGSTRTCGSVDCSGPVHTSGAFHCGGAMAAESITSSGSLKIAKGLTVREDVRASGGLSVGGNLKCAELRSSGGLKVEGDVEAERFETSGGVNVTGMINADEINIQLAMGQNQVGDLGGSKVTVSQSVSSGLLSSLWKNAGGSLTANSIEGDEVELDRVKAKVVRGVNVVIHGGCDIEQVEYTETCTVEENAHVGNCVKV